MNADEVARCTDRAAQLWPEWELTSAQREVWETSFRVKPNVGRAIWAIDEHYRRCAGFRSPSLSKILAILSDAERDFALASGAATSPRGSLESTWRAEIERDNTLAQRWCNGLGDEELVDIARRVNAFAGVAGGFLSLSKRSEETPAQYVARLRRPHMSMVLSAGVSAIAERENP